MKSLSLAVLGVSVTAWTASAETAMPTIVLTGIPIAASVVPGQPSCEGTDQIQYRVTFSVVRVQRGKSPAKKPTAIVCSHQRAGIFDAAAYLLVGTEQGKKLRFDAYKAQLITCPGKVQLPDMAFYKLQATGAASTPSEGGNCVLF